MTFPHAGAQASSLSQRAKLLLVTQLRAAHEAEGAYDSVSQQSPNLCWPDDRTWCTVTEIDPNSTYVGCDDACADEIVAASDVEALIIDSATGIDLASDVLNPAPTDEP